MSDINDPLGLGINLQEVDTGRPVLAEDKYVMEIKDIDVKENKKQTGRNLVVIFATIQAETSVKASQDGLTGDIKAGFTVRKYYPLQQSDNPDAPDFREDLARLQDAVEGSTKENRNPRFDPYSFKGQKVIVGLKVENDEQYGQSNAVRSIAHFEG